jgi:hypothetical protein
MALQEYSIPRSLWESLDAIMHTKGIALAKEVAKELGLPPQPLIASLNTDERSKFTILPDEDDSQYQCQALVHHGATYMRCRCPMLGPAPRFCSKHERYSKDMTYDLPLVERLQTSEEILLHKDSVVYTLNGQRCGILRGQVLTRFQIE